MRSCHVAKCGRKISDGVQLFPLPQNSVRRQLSLDKIKRREANRYTKIKNIRICSKHFYGGKPAKEMYPRHPDFVPSLLLGDEPLKLIESTHLSVIQDHSLPIDELDQHNIPSNCEESLHTTMEYEVPSDENPSETTLDQDSLCHESPSQSGNEIDCIPIPAVECFTTSQVSNSTTNLDDNLEGELQRLRLIVFFVIDITGCEERSAQVHLSSTTPEVYGSFIIEHGSSLLAEEFRLLPEIRLLQGDEQQTIHKQ
ncbi:hypothetical protein OUZ56_016228 [Daphnia magna]|uniref:THAP-type domain-containing protein n=1 Tax=Daphnia magna TaxID=35525 RepID=A0ABR0AQ21_9CRUS|nr:hypothetical protein OUZ56_016228 [Daphnia magna]